MLQGLKSIITYAVKIRKITCLIRQQPYIHAILRNKNTPTRVIYSVLAYFLVILLLEWLIVLKWNHRARTSSAVNLLVLTQFAISAAVSVHLDVWAFPMFLFSCRKVGANVWNSQQWNIPKNQTLNTSSIYVIYIHNIWFEAFHAKFRNCLTKSTYCMAVTFQGFLCFSFLCSIIHRNWVDFLPYCGL